jgi:AraC-like DNA-binding protein
MWSEVYIPADILKPFVKTFLIIESENGMDNRLLPDTSIVIAFRCKGTVKFSLNGTDNNVPLSVITGLRRSSRIVHYDQKTINVLVVFKEGGAAAFFREPLHSLFGVSLSLDQLIARYKIAEVEERLAETQNNSERFAIVEQFLLSQLKEYQPDYLIADAVRQIRKTNGEIRIKDLVASLHISQDSFEKRFRRIIGTSPKQFSSIIRFRNLIDNYTPASSLTNMAYAAGYFDQAHFIKDFKSFTGLAPHDFFKTTRYW